MNAKRESGNGGEDRDWQPSPHHCDDNRIPRIDLIKNPIKPKQPATINIEVVTEVKCQAEKTTSEVGRRRVSKVKSKWL